MRGGKVSEEGERRLDAMVRSNDGFEIAELDLELRGPGEFFGTKQAGIPSFRVANIIRDRQLLEAAKREAAFVISGPNTEISKEEIDRALREMRSRWAMNYGLVEVGYKQLPKRQLEPSANLQSVVNLITLGRLRSETAVVIIASWYKTSTTSGSLIISIFVRP